MYRSFRVNLKDRIEVFDRDSKLLEEITSRYPRDSAHYEALVRAQSALWCVLRDGHAGFQERVNGMHAHIPGRKQ
jgi:hypothetical protein